MPDTLTTFTDFIHSPPGQLAAGSVLGGIVWKFFERVENVLTEKTKLEIAGSLLGVNVGLRVEPWPKTFAQVLDGVFGTKLISWKCFWLSAIISGVTLLFSSVFLLGRGRWSVQDFSGIFYDYVYIWIGAFVFNVLPDYLSLLKTRFLIARISKLSGKVQFAALLADFLVTSCVVVLGVLFGLKLTGVVEFDPWAERGSHGSGILFQADRGMFTVTWFGLGLLSTPFLIPALFTWIWIWLYVASGFILKAARRFDIGFDWFNRTFDIEKKPLSSIGLVAGALVALLYWTAALIRHFV